MPLELATQLCRRLNSISARTDAGPLTVFLPKLLLTTLLGSFFIAPTAIAADLSKAQEFFETGQYAECIALTGEAIEDRDFSESWRTLRIEAQLAIGQYAPALESLTAALERYPHSIRLRWLGRDVYRYNAKPDDAERMVVELIEKVQQASWRYRNVADRLVLAEFLLEQGADAKEVLQSIFDQIKKDQPNLPDAFIASGELALAKHDYGLAATEFEKARKLDEDDPRIAFGLSQAYAPSDAEKAQTALQQALERNPRHVPSLLSLVDDQVDAERYETAHKTLAEIETVNPLHPKLWAYRAVLAHLENEPDEEQAARERALSTWPTNPEVDYLIGKKLSQKYRFAEGAKRQRQALEFDPYYLPAKMQLSQDLLRLGQEDEGWKLASEVFERDGYSVVAHNLSILHDHLDDFAILKSDGFLVRMDARESRIYGSRVLETLRRAKAELASKYDVELPETVFVDIYPKQQDFAIRTFGLPGGAGFLGVCFGSVITMNSPASQGATPANWQSVLWHEFCHVVTLTKTNNRMPRWLSEGISVYEERQANPAWGESMNRQYREMILGEDLTPVSQLSAAFLRPETPIHLQFAYYESSLVVEYIIEQHGLDTLKQILVDLGRGLPINECLERTTGSLTALDADFSDYARNRAKNWAPDADFGDPELPRSADLKTLAKFVEDHPKNVAALQRYATRLVAGEQWETAEEILTQSVELFPERTGSEAALAMLVRVHREQENTDAERKTLERFIALKDNAWDASLRLAELASERKDWAAVLSHAERVLSINPLIPAPHRYLADAGERSGDDDRALTGLLALAEMEPFDPAALSYRTAKLFQRTGQTDSARRHVLQALEEAPRYRDAQRLLLAIVEGPTETPTSTDPPPAIAEDRTPNPEDRR
ncbi:tetratricopeptide repeat protein [Thalassoroseus pseudoceratinae]|uniref:tetratricopeptide repeat protein n=1 Tax=Thalassoroseus pseudoceratinae TaxID=2713176 RepID=UPI00197D7E9C|nr:tetratricopeptide repeat protein [Thalassoroseus pseudoceratinae]